MNQYLDLLKKVKQEGKEKGDRTGTGTISVFGYQMRYDLSQNFPLLTTKKVHFKSMAYELLWFLKGDPNINYLKDKEELVIGDFGCGEGDLAKEIGKKSKVFSFDMYPVNDSIIQCDVADGVPIAPNTLDLAVFSLSLMTKDWKNMLATAKKALKITGQIIIWNPKNKITEDELIN